MTEQRQPSYDPLDTALAGGADGPSALGPLVDVALDALRLGAHRRGGPLPAGTPAEVARAVAAATGGALLPDRGTGARTALASLATELAAGTADPADPHCAGHLHCPPLAVAVAAEVAAAALNPSLDSWDQGPSATELEPLVIATLAGLVGYPTDGSGGVITTGGTESNLMGLLLARDAAVLATTGSTAATVGLGAVGSRLRYFCSEVAHFSVRRNAALLGLGEEAVVPVPVDRAYRMNPAALADRLAATVRAGGVPAAVVATAGTTDFGSVDPLPEIAEITARHRTWLHVDAAYGGGALFSDRLAGLLHGLSGADSVALDLHKLGWQPVAAGVFLTADAAALAPLSRRVAYLNPADDEAAGYPSLLGHSLRTTRRVDAFKLAVTFRALGRHGLGALVDACHDLARHAAARIAASPYLELAAEPVLTTVVFRYRAGARGDRVNAALRRRLLADGSAVVGRTEVGDAVWLKLTLLNPHATSADVDALLDLVIRAGAAEQQAAAEQQTGTRRPGAAAPNAVAPRARTSDTPEEASR
ncbi:pyridoxal phosphate-dependent decarboxylase family protein [Micromonospora sp. NBC_01796]|uniref:pyridoxal phosphate-dependent decarboxylase family protein n=1 Tax=Micromonospora sp. NBC_01796 TaxID=2975987 RepID=UPI002DDABF1A|nr:pyridoxal-dependent decarboxylase [Micromonospora sp. NBC_01796]WSA85430.1 pyridoxal-dependent decarboxylase [Micromonospora sp. NBC_01796]